MTNIRYGGDKGWWVILSLPAARQSGPAADGGNTIGALPTACPPALNGCKSDIFAHNGINRPKNTVFGPTGNAGTPLPPSLTESFCDPSQGNFPLTFWQQTVGY